MKNRTGRFFEADCSKQMGWCRKMLPIFLCSYDGWQRYTCRIKIVIVWLECRVQGEHTDLSCQFVVLNVQADIALALVASMVLLTNTNNRLFICVCVCVCVRYFSWTASCLNVQVPCSSWTSGFSLFACYSQFISCFMGCRVFLCVHLCNG